MTIGELAERCSRGKKRRNHFRHRLSISAAIVAQVDDNAARICQRVLATTGDASKLERDLMRKGVDADDCDVVLVADAQARRSLEPSPREAGLVFLIIRALPVDGHRTA